MASVLAPSLTLIFKASLAQGTLPDDWKKAFVIPIYKKGDRSCAANYRPISLTSLPCKIMEHIICSNIFSHLDGHGILCDEHWPRTIFTARLFLFSIIYIYIYIYILYTAQNLWRLTRVTRSCFLHHSLYLFGSDNPQIFGIVE